MVTRRQVNRDSEATRNRSATAGGGTIIGDVLYLAVLTAGPPISAIRTTYQCLRIRGTSAKIVTLAVTRKRLRRLNALLRNKKLWEGA